MYYFPEWKTPSIRHGGRFFKGSVISRIDFLKAVSKKRHIWHTRPTNGCKSCILDSTRKNRYRLITWTNEWMVFWFFKIFCLEWNGANGCGSLIGWGKPHYIKDIGIPQKQSFRTLTKHKPTTNQVICLSLFT